MTEIIYRNLRVTLLSNDDSFSLALAVASGHADFTVFIPLTFEDHEKFKVDEERAAFLQAALHHPFQLKETWLDENTQRDYLDNILHANRSATEKFLTELDNHKANGAIANMVRITTGKSYESLRKGEWFTTSL